MFTDTLEIQILEDLWTAFILDSLWNRPWHDLRSMKIKWKLVFSGDKSVRKVRFHIFIPYVLRFSTDVVGRSQKLVFTSREGCNFIDTQMVPYPDASGGDVDIKKILIFSRSARCIRSDIREIVRASRF